ncbi:hypothetical protein ACFLRI_02410 [Bacteroidota bacterium]
MKTIRKNHFFLVGLLFSFTVLLCSYSPPPAKNKVSVEISMGKITINKLAIQYPWAHTFFKIALGNENRIEPGVNDIYTYDKLGIILYKKSGSEYISDFNIYMGVDPDEDSEFIPTGLFKGKLLIEDISITASTSLNDIKKLLLDYKFHKSSLGAYRGEYKGLYIYVQFDVNEQNIYWMAVGRKS